jgi:hypothetical protein
MSQKVYLLVVALVALPACAATLAPRPEAPVSFRFSPGGHPASSVATRAALPLDTEMEARDVEAAGGDYVGELSLVSGAPTGNDIALEAASRGATHYRLVPHAGGERVVLFHVARERWVGLPMALRPLES